jgi:hypothetical protein
MHSALRGRDLKMRRINEVGKIKDFDQEYSAIVGARSLFGQDPEV